MNDLRPSPAGDASAPFRVVMIYAAFAALWILLSDSVVQWLFADPAQIVLASMVKGWLFVVITSLLLYVLMRRITGTGKVGAGGTAPGTLRWIPMVLVASMIVLLTGGGVYHTIAHQKETEVARLQAIADLKTELITGWLKERMRDANFIRSSVLFPEQYRLWRQQGDAKAGDVLKTRLGQFRNENSFSDVLLIDPDGRKLWSVTTPDLEPDPALREAIVATSRDHQVRHQGPYRSAEGALHLDFLVPLAMGQGVPAPVVVLHANPQDWLFPALQHWPIPSPSGETLLFRRDGDEVLFLNELRHRADSAAKHRVPISRREVLAAQVLRGEARDGEVVTGRDYRGVPVLGVVRAIPDSDWHMVAKLDEEEVYAEATRDSTWIVMAGLLSLFMAFAAFALLRQRNELLLAATLQESEKRFHDIVEATAD
jgi:hypothetical protein